MLEKEFSFKIPPKKFQPKGLTILYEDQHILIVDKMQGLLTMGTEREKEKTAYFLLNAYVKKGNERSRNRVFIVHRLDRDTSGLLVFARNEYAKRFLQDHWQGFSKKYYAVVHGKFREKEGEISSFLFESKAYKVHSVNDPESGKFAKTGFKVLKESEKYSLLEINLFTGRKNQIRVHLSDEGHPVVGDKIYGKTETGIKRLALHAFSLTITHPFSKKEMRFETEIPAYFKALVKS